MACNSRSGHDLTPVRSFHLITCIPHDTALCRHIVKHTRSDIHLASYGRIRIRTDGICDTCLAHLVLQRHDIDRKSLIHQELLPKYIIDRTCVKCLITVAKFLVRDWERSHVDLVEHLCESIELHHTFL